VRVAGAEGRAGDRLRLGADAVQHDRLRMVEPGEDVDPPRRPEDPGLPRQGVAQRRRQGRRPAVAVVEQQRCLGVRAGGEQRTGRDHTGRRAEHHLRE
jgi:hypothetical protein